MSLSPPCGLASKFTEVYVNSLAGASECRDPVQARNSHTLCGIETFRSEKVSCGKALPCITGAHLSQQPFFDVRRCSPLPSASILIGRPFPATRGSSCLEVRNPG